MGPLQLQPFESSGSVVSAALIPRPSANLSELLEIARKGGVFQRAEEQGIAEFAVRKIVLRLGGEGIGKDDLLPWLDNWIEAAQRELGRRTNEDEAFEAARLEAERRFRAGLDNPSSALMEEFAREEQVEADRQVERKRRRIRILEQAIRMDELALDADAAAEKLRLMAEIEGRSGWRDIGEFLFAKAGEFFERGDQKGENSALLVSIAAYREALKEWTRERVPLEWAMTQMNLGTALPTLGERESGTGKLEEAVAAYREALKEWTRERVPLDWATTQMNLGAALQTLGERESGTGKLEEAVAAYREALKEWTRERVPLDWAMTQMNLGNALSRLGERESGTAQARGGGRGLSRGAEGKDARARSARMGDDADESRQCARERSGSARAGRRKLEEAVAAYREALKEWTRERVPLEWATTQMNLGNALSSARGARERDGQARGGGRGLSRGAEGMDARARSARMGDDADESRQCARERSGSARAGRRKLEEAVAAYREALKERTRERVPLDWATTQMNLGNALERSGSARAGRASSRRRSRPIARR